MKTWARKNQSKLLLVGTLLLVLAVLWSVNIYKIWWNFTPWKRFGFPPQTQIVKVGQIDFPDDPDIPSFFSPAHYYSNNLVNGFRPEVYVHGEGNGEIFVLRSLKGEWDQVDSVRNPLLDNELIKVQTKCAATIQSKWKLADGMPARTRVMQARGLCITDHYQYVVYRIDANDSFLMKYMNSDDPEFFRMQITYVISILTMVLVVIWLRPALRDVLDKASFKHDPLGLKPDYDAN